MVEIKSYSKLKSNNGTDSASGIGGGSGYINTTIATKLKQIHSLWGNQFDGTQDVLGPISAPSVDVSNNLSVHGNSVFDGPATFGDQTKFKKDVSINGTLDVSAGATFGDQTKFKKDVSINGTLDVSSDANFNSQSTFKGTATFNSNANTTNVLPLKNKEYNLGDDNHQWKNIVSENLLVNNLKVTGSAHFFELIIDKIKSAGGSIMLTPADGFEVEKIKSMANNITLYWRCQDGNGKQRDNMWKVNDQALCMSFNQATVGTSHNVNNKYYWCLVTDVSDNNNPIEIDGQFYNYISISRFDSVGVVNPEIGDSIVMCGYRGTDDKKRQSALYMSAYASLDNGLKAPLFAQYQGINDFDLESHRKSYYDANSAKFIGEFEATDGQNIIDIINKKIKDSEASIKLNTKNIVLSVSEKTQERRNLLKGTTFHRQLDNFTISSTARIEMNSGYNGSNCIKVIDDTDGISHYVGVYWDGSQGGRSVKIEKGKKYTISCYYKTNDSNAKFSLEAIYTDKETNAKRLGRPRLLSPNQFNPKYNQWELFKTVIDTTDAESDYIAFNFWEYCKVEAGRINAYICRPMVEEGDTYYGWTLSDLDNDYVGANLIDNSRTFQVGGNILSVTGNKTLVGDVYELTASGSDNYNPLYRIKGDAFKLNTDYTLSFEVRGDAKYLQVNAFYPANNTKYTYYREQQNDLMYETAGDGTTVAYAILGEFEVISKQQKVWVHFRFKDRLPEQIYFQFTKNSEQTGVTSWSVTITKPKIEEGANVTEWTEKKTDVENSLTTITNNVATLTQKADSIESNVTSNTTNINNITGQLSSQSTSISRLEQKADSITSTVSNMTKSNGTNIFSFTNTDFQNYWCRSSIQMNGFFTLKLNQGIYRLQNLGTNGEGGDFVVSFDARVLKNTTVNVNFCDIGAEENHGDIALTTTFQHYVLHFKNIQSDYLNKALYNGFIDFEPKTPDETNQLYVANFMLERGTIPSENFSISEADRNNYGKESFTDWEKDPRVQIVNETINGKSVQAYKVEGVPSGETYVNMLQARNLQKSMKIQPQKVYTLSFWAKASESGHGIYCYLWPDISDIGLNGVYYKGINGAGTQEQKTSSVDGATLCEIDSTWRKFYIHWHPHKVGDTIRCNVGRVYANMAVWLSDVKLEEGYICDENITNQETYSSIKQTAESILAQVNDTYIKIGDGNITLNGDTKVNGSLTLTQTDQGFKLVGSDGITEIKPESIGTYDNFKAANTSTQNVVKTINVNGAKSVSDDILRFQGSLIIYLGDRKKGDFIKCKFNSLTADVTNAWDGSSFSKTFALSSSFSAKVVNQYNSAVIHNWNTVYSNREYSYTFDSDTTNARIYVTFSGNTLYSSWIGNYNVYQGGKPMPMPNAAVKVNGTLELPMAAHMLIGYDGWGINFGNNKLVYCGKEGFVAKYGDNEFRITDAGISHNNMATTYTIIGSSSSSSPTTYTVQDPIDTVLCKSGYCKVIFPSNPYNGQRIKIYDKSPAESYINSNGKYVCSADRRYSDRSIWTNQNLSYTAVRIYTYINDTWFEEFTG